MLQAFRTSPVLIIQVTLILVSGLVFALVGFFMARSGASLRPACWMLGLMLLIVGPQFIATLWLSLRDVTSSEPRTAALAQLATSSDADTLKAAAKILFGPDADALLVTDARQMFGDAFANAELVRFAALPNGDSVLLARFKGGFAAEKGWIAYLRVTGLNQFDGKGDSQRGYAVTRPGGDRAFVLHFGNMVGVWTGRDDAAIRQRMVAGGFEIPRRAPLAEVAATPRRPESSSDALVADVPITNLRQATRASLPRRGDGASPLLVAALIALNVFIVVLYYFKGAAWAGTNRANPGKTPVTASELATRLESINALDVPFRIERGTQPNEFFAT